MFEGILQNEEEASVFRETRDAHLNMTPGALRGPRASAPRGELAAP